MLGLGLQWGIFMQFHGILFNLFLTLIPSHFKKAITIQSDGPFFKVMREKDQFPHAGLSLQDKGHSQDKYIALLTSNILSFT